MRISAHSFVGGATEFAQRAGISRTRLVDLLEGRHGPVPPQPDELRRIAAGLRIPVAALLAEEEGR